MPPKHIHQSRKEFLNNGNKSDNYFLDVKSGDETTIPLLAESSSSFNEEPAANHYDALRSPSPHRSCKFSDKTPSRNGHHFYRQPTPKKAFDFLQRSAKKFVKSKNFLLSTHSTIEGQSLMSKCTNFHSLMNLIKGTTGTGILTLPMAFKNGGLWVGLFGFLILASVAVHSMHLLNKCVASLERRTKIHINNYQEAVFHCVKNGPKQLQPFAEYVSLIVSVCINIMQCSFCCVYIVWVATNVKSVLDLYWDSSPDVRIYSLIVFVLLLPYAMVKSLRTLAVFSAVSNVLFVIGLIIIFQYILQIIPDYHKRPAIGSFSTIPSAFGTAIFSYESISLIVPIRSKMETPEDFGGYAGVLNLGMVILTSIYAAIGFYGYLRFGDDVAPAITMNLPDDNGLYLSVRLIFAAAVFISVGVQFYVPITNLWPHIEKRLGPDRNKTLYNCLTRIGLIMLIYIFGVIVPHFELLMALLGSLFGSILSIIVPASLDIITLHSEDELSVLDIVKNSMVITIGVLGLFTGTYTSLVDIVNTF